jgi:glycosyltransferase involved in cell wall biosynthesis
VRGLQTASNDATYEWQQGDQADFVTVFPERVYEEIPTSEMRRGVIEALDRLRPDAVAIAGWGFPDARACLDWCKRNNAKAIVMSETRAADGHRVWWKEWLKSRLVSRFDAAIVGGTSHADYLVRLGIRRDRIVTGYDVVDDRYFATEAEKWRRESIKCRENGAEAGSPLHVTRHPLPVAPPFFLASNRFIERKNLARLIEAFARYGKSVQCSVASVQKSAEDASPSTLDARHAVPPWNLCLLGDGELKADLIAQCKELGLAVEECAPFVEKVESEQRKVENQRESTVEGTIQDPCHSVKSVAKQEGSNARCSNPDLVDALDPRLSTLDSPATPTVFFPGFRQIDELPWFYANAGCFVHPALEEPWGLVLNEAAACGLPILSGDNVGAAEELVEEGVNGWTFDATNVDAITEGLCKVAGLSPEARKRMGGESRRILAERAPSQAFGEGLARLLGVRMLLNHS